MLQLQCLPLPPPPPDPPTFHDPQIYLHPSPIPIQAAAGIGNSIDGSATPTPAPASGSGSSPQPSPSHTLNLSRVYTKVVHTDSYKEMWSITRSIDRFMVSHEPGDQDEDSNHQVMLTQVLRPDRECVLDALSCAKSNTLTTLISSYFDYSEETSSVCLNLQKSVDEARRLYCPLHALINDLPIHSPSPSQSYCDLVFQELLKFDGEDNPFPRPDSQSHTFNRIRDVFSHLKGQLERRLRKSSSRIRLVPHDSAACCVGLGSLTSTPKFVKREVAQLKVASRSTYVLKTDLDTLDSLVRRLHNAVEDDKHLIRLGLKIGNDKHTIQEILKLLEKNHQNLVHYLDLLEEKICTCFTTVNRSRSQLLREISGHQTTSNL